MPGHRLAPRLSRSLAALLVAAAALAAGAPLGAAEPIDPADFDMRPLLRVQAVGHDIAGGVLEVDALVHRGGPSLFAATAETADACRVSRAVASPGALGDLRRAFNQAQIGRLRGDCGTPLPDSLARYSLTWYRPNGRERTIQVGAFYDDCPAAERQVFDAVCRFLWETHGPVNEYCGSPG